MLRYIISAKIVIGQYEEYRKKFAAFDLDNDGHLVRICLSVCLSDACLPVCLAV
jgi:Ca2+-binding EF-hand superfamily protein